MAPKILRFRAYSLHIDPTFWSTLYGRKLDTWKLDDSEKNCYAIVTNNSVHLDRSSLDVPTSATSTTSTTTTTTTTTTTASTATATHENSTPPVMNLKGIIKVFNTRNDLSKFFEENKQTLLRTQHQFIMLVHVDLKQYSFDYFFALPTMYPSSLFYARIEDSNDYQNRNVIFMPYQVTRERESFVLPWILRNKILEERQKGTRLYEFICNGNGAGNRIVLHIDCPKPFRLRYTGWSSPTLTTVSLSQTMDPHLIAEQNAELNLKLMMWKHEPNLPLDKLRKLNCLLVGAGTVGCTVARNLIAWGMRDITFVDCANVSHSNPVRQNLYTANDIGKPKAQTAAETLGSILPTVNSKGYTLDIPMPGHSQSGKMEDFVQLNQLIQSSDVIFLSTDSREGRWLVILLAQIHGKKVINIALGYETMLVQYIKEDNGCYFCVDPIGPRDTMTSRTIDEKCTITRPGISFIASAMAVEFYVDIVRGAAKHHQIRFNFTDMKFLCHETHKNPMCSCCSVEMISELVDKGYRFVEEVKWEPSILEDISGYMEQCNLSDNDLESMEDEGEDEDEDDDATAQDNNTEETYVHPYADYAEGDVIEDVDHNHLFLEDFERNLHRNL